MATETQQQTVERGRIGRIANTAVAVLQTLGVAMITGTVWVISAWLWVLIQTTFATELESFTAVQVELMLGPLLIPSVLATVAAGVWFYNDLFDGGISMWDAVTVSAGVAGFCWLVGVAYVGVA